LSDDLRLFREITSGHAVLMGRKTFDSIGKPLPNRTNLVLSRDVSLTIPGCHVFSSIAAAIEFVKKGNNDNKDDDELMIIGGEALFKETHAQVNRVYLTRVLAEVEGDTFFHFSFSESEGWKQLGETRHFDSSDRNQYPFDHLVFERVAPVATATSQQDTAFE